MNVDAVYAPDLSTRYALPVFLGRLPAGFPSPADDYIEGKLDLNRHLIKHPAATFFVRVTGDSMTGAGIHSGDLLTVDRSLEAIDGNVVVAALDGNVGLAAKFKAGLAPSDGIYGIGHRAFSRQIANFAGGRLPMQP